MCFFLTKLKLKNNFITITIIMTLSCSDIGIFLCVPISQLFSDEPLAGYQTSHINQMLPCRLLPPHTPPFCPLLTLLHTVNATH